MRSGKLLSRCHRRNTSARGNQAGLRRYRSLWEIVGKQGGLGSLFGVISWRCFGFWSKQRIKPRSGSITGHRFLGGRSDHLIICRGNGLGRGERREKAMLLQLGCECAQGYGIARPMPIDDWLPWVERWQAPQTGAVKLDTDFQLL